MLKKGIKVCVRKNIDSELDPGRYRGTCGKVVRKSKEHKGQFLVKMDRSKDVIIWHEDDLVRK